MSVVAAAIIFCGSMLFTTVAFPTYFQDLRDAHAEMLRAAGRGAAEIEAEVAKAAVGQTLSPTPSPASRARSAPASWPRWSSRSSTAGSRRSRQQHGGSLVARPDRRSSG